MNLYEELAQLGRINRERVQKAKDLFAQGVRPTDIAIELDVSKTTVWRWLNDRNQKKRAS